MYVYVLSCIIYITWNFFPKRSSRYSGRHYSTSSAQLNSTQPTPNSTQHSDDVKGKTRPLSLCQTGTPVCDKCRVAPGEGTSDLGTLKTTVGGRDAGTLWARCCRCRCRCRHCCTVTAASSRKPHRPGLLVVLVVVVDLGVGVERRKGLDLLVGLVCWEDETNRVFHNRPNRAFFCWVCF